MVGSGLLAEHGHRRQHAGHVAGQEDDGIRLAGTVFRHTLLDVLQRVGGTRVLAQTVITVIRATTVIQHHVFQHGTELDRVPDHRLVLLGQVDALGVAAAFDVEDGTFAPAMLVITDQVTRRVGGQGGLAGA